MPPYQQHEQVERARADGHRDRNGVLISPEQTAGPAVEAKPSNRKISSAASASMLPFLPEREPSPVQPAPR